MTEDRSFDPSRLNLTELVAICVQLNPEAHRALPRELLEQISLGKEVELPARAVNKMRLKIMTYINENFSQIEYQVNCPAKSRDPYACFTCSDLQVASCTFENRSCS